MALFCGVLLCPRIVPGEAHADSSKLAGAYLSHEGRKDPFMSLSLGADGTATLTEDPGAGALVRFGHWTESAGVVTMKFDPKEGKPAVSSMIFKSVGGGLQAATWDHVFWGKATPPPMKKDNGVKGSYWFSTVR